MNFFCYCGFCCCCGIFVSFLFPLFISNKFRSFFKKLRFVHFLFHWLLTFLIIFYSDWNYPQSSVPTYTNFNLKSFITNINISFSQTSLLVYWFSRYCLVNIMKDKSKNQAFPTTTKRLFLLSFIKNINCISIPKWWIIVGKCVNYVKKELIRKKFKRMNSLLTVNRIS